MLLAIALTRAALAGPDDLAESERTAHALIEACHTQGPRCGATPDELAQAFVTTAVAGAVLRGELDRAAVADAELLSPGIVDRWEALVPTAADRPDDWVGRWVDGPVPDNPFRARHPREPAAPPARTSETWLRAGPNELFDPSGVRLEAGRFGAAGGVAFRAAGEADLWPGALDGRVSAGIGPRWSGRRGAQFAVLGGADAWTFDGRGPSVGPVVDMHLWAPSPDRRFSGSYDASLGYGGTWSGEPGHVLFGTELAVAYQPGSSLAVSLGTFERSGYRDGFDFGVTLGVSIHR